MKSGKNTMRMSREQFLCFTFHSPLSRSLRVPNNLAFHVVRVWGRFQISLPVAYALCRNPQTIRGLFAEFILQQPPPGPPPSPRLAGFSSDLVAVWRHLGARRSSSVVGISSPTLREHLANVMPASPVSIATQ
ncbi:hypothetical protein BaRGS_00001503 [Batillaria attramentaria]|uniref:Uncharacterized protein n=1 Tax=Batillaria attramentaria TaxID=370345 RepID=A0ABD0M7U6_9CAEN